MSIRPDPHRAQLEALLSSPDPVVVQQGCELIVALADPAVTFHFGRGSYLDPKEGFHIGQKVRDTVTVKKFRGWVSMVLALSRLQLRPRREPLERLFTHYRYLGPQGATALATTTLSLSLHELDLRYAYIGDEGAIRLAAADILAPNASLFLQRNDIGPDGASALAAGPLLQDLSILDLRYNPIGLQGAIALARSPLHSLRQLFLYRDDVGAEGAQVLANAARLPRHIRRLWRGQ